MQIFPKKGVYYPNEPISLTVEPRNINLTYRIQMYDKDMRVFEGSFAGAEDIIVIPPKKPFAGYCVLCLSSTGDTASCAVNVQSDGSVFRYGFLSNFTAEDKDEDIISMSKHHIDAVQFYDWSYRHDQLVSPTETYIDMMGKENRLSVIKRKIFACHSCGMKAIAYGAVYASCEEFAQQHQDWRLFCGKGKPLRFIDVFSIMNPASPWRNHLIKQYTAALQLGFDGIHMDTYGFPKSSIDINGTPVRLENELPRLISDTRNALPDATLVFNNVGAWPLYNTVKSPVDAVYVEVWPPYERYCHIKNLIEQMSQSKKPMVVAAYPAAFRTDSAERGLNSQLILMSAISLHGATQIWFGEDCRAITQGYYEDNYELSSEQEAILRKYDDFFVQYQEILYDTTLQDVSFSHCGWDNQEYCCNVPFSVDGAAEKLWLILRENARQKVISFINLCGDSCDLWANGREAPSLIPKATFEIQVEQDVSGVYYATPDSENPLPVECDFTYKQTDRSKVVCFTIKNLFRCGLIWIRFKE